MLKSALSVLFISTSLFAAEVKFCGENVLAEPKELVEVCYVHVTHKETAIVLRFKNGAELTYPVVISGSEYAKYTSLTVENSFHKQGDFTLYRHYVAGIYPGDGENWPIALEGTTPEGVRLKVVELTH